MRQIKFRAWDIQNERMVYDPDRFEPSYSEDEKVISPWVFYETWQDREDGIGRSCQLMQFTGFLDKNRKEIWEGDVVNGAHFNGSYAYGNVVFWTGGWWIEPIPNIEGSCELYNNMFNIEVIGNIYENPDLLK